MLDLSTASHGLMYGSLVVLVVAGLTAGALGGWLGRLWIWTSLGVLLAVTVAMVLIATRHYQALRQLVGASTTCGIAGSVRWSGASTSPRQARTPRPPAPPPDPERVEEELAARLRSRRPELLAAIGGGGLLIVIWLMMVKPF